MLFLHFFYQHIVKPFSSILGAYLKIGEIKERKRLEMTYLNKGHCGSQALA